MAELVIDETQTTNHCSRRRNDTCCIRGDVSLERSQRLDDSVKKKNFVCDIVICAVRKFGGQENMMQDIRSHLQS